MKLLAMALPVIVFWGIYARTLTIPPTDPDTVLWMTAVEAHPAPYYFHNVAYTENYPGFRPTVALAMWLDMKVYGYQAWGYWLSGLVYGTALLVLVFFLAYRFSDSVYGAAAAALFVAVNAKNLSVFCWIVETHQSLLSGLLAVAAILLFLRFQENRSLVILLFCGISAWLSVGAKEPGIAALPAIMLLAWWRRKTCPLRFGVLLVVTVLVSYFTLRFVALGTLIGTYGGEDLALLTSDLPNCKLQELPWDKRLALFIYTPVANFVSMALPSLFTGWGRLRTGWYWFNPAKMGIKNLLFKGSSLVCQLILLAMVLWRIRRNNWKKYALAAAIMVVTAASVFVIYRPRSHFVGVVAYSLLIAVAFGQWASAPCRWRWRHFLFCAVLLMLCLQYTIMDVRYVTRCKAIHKSYDVRKLDSDSKRYSEKVKREIFRRYPPKKTTSP